jgi:hypothetical protein
VVTDASGRRAIVESVGQHDRKLRSAVKWINLVSLTEQLFWIRRMQLDIFNDSRDVMLRNDALSALQRYDAAGARRALQALANEYPDDVAQVYFGSIVNALEGRSTVPFDRHEAALQARQALSQ